jgi:hypothetical protein
MLCIVAVPLQASECPAEHKRNPDARIQRHLDSLLKISKVSFVPIVCEPIVGGMIKGPMAYLPTGNMRPPAISFPSWWARRYKNDELRGVLAHELAHLVRFAYRMASYASAYERDEREEIAADTLGSRWVGKKVMIRGLQTTARLVQAVLSRDHATVNRAELERRIQALQKLP